MPAFAMHRMADNLREDVAAWAADFPYGLSRRRPICMRRTQKNQNHKTQGTHAQMPLGARHSDFQRRLAGEWDRKTRAIVSRTIPLQLLSYYQKPTYRELHTISPLKWATGSRLLLKPGPLLLRWSSFTRKAGGRTRSRLSLRRATNSPGFLLLPIARSSSWRQGIMLVRL